ncbi:hypothetical protein LCGC14_1083370 [marine sediment metagenome]|uniref:Uncharacterized protein n=1 Tax=marine sediment metagenome TaxID=412755 RepID=A0A0F9MJ51_9ZZZZ
MPDNQVTLAHTVASVDNSDTVVVAAAAGRKYLKIQNTHATVSVWILVGAAPTAVANTGIKILAGESYEMTQAANNIDPRAVNGIGSAVGPAVVLVTQAV